MPSLAEAGYRTVSLGIAKSAMRVEKIEIRDTDLQRISNAFDRVVDYKMKGVWSNLCRKTPLPHFHNGLLCYDLDTRARFTQVPYHPIQSHKPQCVVLLDGELAVIQALGLPNYSIQFISPGLWSKVDYVASFVVESLAQSGSWDFPSLEGAKVHAEESAITR
jgi:hypothetical protein